jgi:hypothetical protein
LDSNVTEVTSFEISLDLDWNQWFMCHLDKRCIVAIMVTLLCSMEGWCMHQIIFHDVV